MRSLGLRARLDPSPRTWALVREMCSLLWDYYEPTKYPWWLEDVYGYAAKKSDGVYIRS